MDGLAVRSAESGDAGAIRVVLTAAFPNAAEADLVERLEREGDAVLSLVARKRDRVVGHIMMSRMEAQADGRSLRAVGLAPVAVLPECQKRGIGGALIKAAIEQLRVAGEEIVFVVGEPAYYCRFGFTAAAAAPFASPYAGRYFAALVLGEPIAASFGAADHAPAFAGLE